MIKYTNSFIYRYRKKNLFFFNPRIISYLCSIIKKKLLLDDYICNIPSDFLKKIRFFKSNLFHNMVSFIFMFYKHHHLDINEITQTSCIFLIQFTKHTLKKIWMKSLISEKNTKRYYKIL